MFLGGKELVQNYTSVNMFKLKIYSQTNILLVEYNPPPTPHIGHHGKAKYGDRHTILDGARSHTGDRLQLCR